MAKVITRKTRAVKEGWVYSLKKETYGSMAVFVVRALHRLRHLPKQRQKGKAQGPRFYVYVIANYEYGNGNSDGANNP